MEQLPKLYRITGFWSDEHRVQVYFVASKTEHMIILPVENGQYPEGVDLDNYIMSFCPSVVPTLRPKMPQAKNRDYIASLVREKHAITSRILEKRNRLLAMRHEALLSSDWTQLPDVQEVMDEEDKRRWKEFRQALRDITKQPGWPENVDWPKRPYLLGVTIFNG